jgi:hypothetical protein
MNQTYRLFIPAILLVTMLIGSVYGVTMCPDIPDPPYIPEVPEEDIIKVEAYIEPVNTTVTASTIPAAQSLRPIINGPILYLTVTFAAETPPADQSLLILVSILQGNPPTEVVLDCAYFSDPSSLTYELDPIPVDSESPSIAVYAALGELLTDRAPNDDFYKITSLSASDPNVFQDYEPAPVGGVMVPKNSFEILTPYIALAGLVAAISTVYFIKKESKVNRL